MEKAHCRVCYQSLSGMQTRCRQCGDIDCRRVWHLIGKDGLKVGIGAAIALALWGAFHISS
jgi:hypothetical protein